MVENNYHNAYDKYAKPKVFKFVIVNRIKIIHARGQYPRNENRVIFEYPGINNVENKSY